MSERKYDHSEIMTTQHVAKYLGIHLISVYRLIKDTDIPCFRLKGQWRFRKDVLDAWIDKGIKTRRSDA